MLPLFRSQQILHGLISRHEMKNNVTNTAIGDMFDPGYRAAVVKAYKHFKSYLLAASVFECAVGSVHAWVKRQSLVTSKHAPKWDGIETPIARRAVSATFERNPFSAVQQHTSYACGHGHPVVKKMCGMSHEIAWVYPQA